jgi:hypothetical protein
VSLRGQDAASPKFTYFAGPGAISRDGALRGGFQAGLSLDEAPPNAGVGILLELGYMDTWQKPHAGTGFFSADYMAAWSFGAEGGGRTSTGAPFWRDRGWKFLPFAAAGYTLLFRRGSAANFGGGFDYRFNDKNAIRVEVRDYVPFSNPAQHHAALRVGWVRYIED